MKRMLMLASVASMIDQFNMPNIRLLQEMGYEVHVACNFKKGSTCTEEKIIKLKNTLKDMGVPYYQIDFDRNVLNIANDFKAYRQVVKLAEKYKYNFIHCHSPIGGVVGRCAAHKTHTKVVYTAHGFHFYKGAPLINWMVYYPIEKICSYMTDVLICINKEDYALAKRKMKAKKVEYIPGVGIDLTKYGVSQCVNNKREELGIPTNMMWVLSVGELSHRKNHERLIRAVADIDNIFLTIAGKGELKEYYQNLILKLGVDKRIKLLGFRTDISELCESADVFAFPSLQEGLPVALMEAMACGKPVVCSNIRGNTDLIDDGEGGFLFNPDNSEEIKQSLYKIMRSDLKTMGEKNASKIMNYSLPKIIKEEKGVYSEIIGGGV